MSSGGPSWRYIVGTLGGLIVLLVPAFFWAGKMDTRLEAQENRLNRIEDKLDRALAGK